MKRVPSALPRVPILVTNEAFKDEAGCPLAYEPEEHWGGLGMYWDILHLDPASPEVDLFHLEARQLISARSGVSSEEDEVGKLAGLALSAARGATRSLVASRWTRGEASRGRRRSAALGRDVAGRADGRAARGRAHLIHGYAAASCHQWKDRRGRSRTQQHQQPVFATGWRLSSLGLHWIGPLLPDARIRERVANTLPMASCPIFYGPHASCSTLYRGCLVHAPCHLCTAGGGPIIEASPNPSRP
jgi:hypothetical protein